MENKVEEFGALEGSMRDFRYIAGSNLVDRVSAFYPTFPKWPAA